MPYLPSDVVPWPQKIASSKQQLSLCKCLTWLQVQFLALQAAWTGPPTQQDCEPRRSPCTLTACTFVVTSQWSAALRREQTTGTRPERRARLNLIPAGLTGQALVFASISGEALAT
eukprot:scaffold1382_cov429-Prasinococcus_capsulatus_cf.AAC.3